MFSHIKWLHRFFKNVRFDETSGCWLWTGATSGRTLKYANTRFMGKPAQGHVAAYNFFRGDIPAKQVLDHVVCENPRCVNPWHVEPGTQWENIQRGNSVSANNARKTHCKHGHELTGNNVKWSNDGKHRACWTCIYRIRAEVKARRESQKKPQEKKTRCFNGHDLTPDNVYVKNKGNGVFAEACRECKRMYRGRRA